MYIDNCKNNSNAIKDSFEPARLVKNFFSISEIEQLLLLQFQLAERVKYTQTSNNIQSVCDIDNIFTKLPWLKSKFEKEIGRFSDRHSGNYYITTQLHDAHADLLTEDECKAFEWSKDIIPYKSCVIPLLISDTKAFTAFFNQRHIGYSVTLDRVGISSQEDSDYEIKRDYPSFVNYGKEMTHNYIFPHIPNESLNGLTVENVLEYNIGSVMIFDACQIHASCVSKERPNYRWLKSGMNIQFYKEI